MSLIAVQRELAEVKTSVDRAKEGGTIRTRQDQETIDSLRQQPQTKEAELRRRMMLPPNNVLNTGTPLARSEVSQTMGLTSFILRDPGYSHVI